MGMFSQNELLLMIGVVSVLLICIIILTIFDIKEYLKAKKGFVKEDLDLEYKEEKKVEPITVSLLEDNTDVLTLENNEKLKEEAYFEDMEDESFEIKPDVNPILEEGEEVYVPKTVIQESKIELETPKIEEVKEEIPQREVVEEKKNNVFEELEETIDNLPNKKDDITNFEAEQERTAIISLDELMKKSNELYNDNEVVQYDDGDEPISIDEVIKMFKKEETVEPVVEEKKVPEVLQEVVEEKVPYSKKETIPFISSVYGIEKENSALEFENTATYEKLDRSKYNDFVSQLQEMNENK